MRIAIKTTIRVTHAVILVVGIIYGLFCILDPTLPGAVFIDPFTKAVFAIVLVFLSLWAWDWPLSRKYQPPSSRPQRRK